MKKEYDTSVKEAIERVMSVFSEYIKTTPYFDIVWSGKVGYIYISIDSYRGTVGDMDCLVIDSPEELLDKLLYEMAVDIMEEGGHDLNPVEASALERAEVARRLNVYLEQLPEFRIHQKTEPVLKGHALELRIGKLVLQRVGHNAQPHFTQLGYRCFSQHHLFPLP